MLIIFTLFTMLTWNEVAELTRLEAGNPVPAHHTGDGFQNPYPTWRDHGFKDLIKWTFSRKPEIPQHYTLPWVDNNLQFLGGGDRDSTISFTWIGHATFLIEMNGVTILTDPFFSDRASPVQWMGPKRMVPPAISLDSLPQIDYAVISHNHYDHLDYPAVKHLAEHGTRFITPLKMDDWFRHHGMPEVTSLDWWESTFETGIRFTATPSQHFCARTPFDRNEVLWASWIIQSGDGTIYFAGDTGYFPGFTEIGQRFPGIDVALLPIGAYEPRWFMQVVHLTPADAVQAYKDLGANQAIAMHWGTIQLTDEAMDEPSRLLFEQLSAHNISEEAFAVFAHGETRQLGISGWDIIMGTAAEQVQRNYALP